MAFEVPASKASIKQNQFEFKVPGEKRARVLPKLEFLPIALRQRMAALGKPLADAQEAGRDPAEADLEAMGQFQLDLLDKYTPGVTEALDEEQLAALMAAWAEASGINLGE